jgi:7-cyano-7-deazaguanine synthase
VSEATDRAVVLVSGGMDSVTLLHHVARARGSGLVALSFAYGQKHSRELEMAARQARLAGVRDHRVVDMAFYGQLTRGGSALTDPGLPVPDLAAIAETARRQPPTYVPHRNLVLLSLACGVAEAAGAGDVFYGAQAQDEVGYWDCTLDFVGRLNDVLRLNRARPVRIHAPFAEWRKAEVLRLGLSLGVDFAATWSCYRGAEGPCGTCPSCVERARAFRELGVTDPLENSSDEGSTA